MSSVYYLASTRTTVPSSRKAPIHLRSMRSTRAEHSTGDVREQMDVVAWRLASEEKRPLSPSPLPYSTSPPPESGPLIAKKLEKLKS